MLENVYRSFARFVQHLQLQKANIDQFKNEVSATGQEITDINNDADSGEFLEELLPLCTEFKESATGIKNLYYSTKTEPPVGVFMNPPNTTPPVPIIAGAVKRARERDQHFLNSPNLTEAAKIAMDLVGDTPPNVQPDTVKPTVEVHVAATNYEGAVVLGNRQKSDSARIFIQRAANAARELAGDGTGKSINFSIQPTDSSKPERVLVIVQLRKNNQNYGQPSDPVYATFNP